MATEGHIFKEGWLEKKASKWRKYYAVLQADRLFFFKSENRQKKDELQGHIDITSANVVQIGESKKKNYQFSVTGNSGRYPLKVPTAELRDEWVQAIKECGDRKSRGGAPPLPGGHPGGGGGGPPPLPGGHPGGGGGGPPPLPGGHPRSSSMSASRPLPPPPKPSQAPPIQNLSLDSGSNLGFKPPPPDPSDPFSKESWHFGTTTRAVAEEILSRHGGEGSFLIRASESSKGDYSLSVLDQKQPKHYKVTSRGGTLHLSGCADQTFTDLKGLVDYYTSASKGRTSPLDKVVVEKMDAAFAAPAIVQPGLMLPGQIIAAQMAAEANGGGGRGR